MKRYFKVFVALVSALVSEITLAQAVDLTSTQIFDVKAIDPSLAFLGQVFGTVGSVLHGTSGMLLGVVFKTFNIGIIFVSSTFLIWAVVKTLITTSHEGKFMGAQGKPAWLIMRTVLGLGLLTPNLTTGYSTIQVFVMWVVLQGVGFANTAWYQVVDYIEAQGSIMSQPVPPTPTYLNLAGTLLMMEVCMYTSEAIETKRRQDAVAAGNIPAADAQFFSSFEVQRNNTSFFFPAQRGNKDAGCGQISWVVPNKTDADNTLVKDGLDLMISGIAPAARKYAEQYSAAPDDMPAIRARADALAVDRMIGAVADFVNVTLPLTSVGRVGKIPSVVEAATTETKEDIGWGGPKAVREFSEAVYEKKLTAFFKSMHDNGWLYAGSFYYAIGQLQGNFLSDANINPSTVAGPLGINLPPGQASYIRFSEGSISPSYNQNDDTLAPELKGYYTQAGAAAGLAKQVALNNAAQTLSLQVNAGGDTGGTLSGMIGPLMDNQNEALSQYGQPTTAAPDPILLLQNVGNKMILIAFIAWIIITILVFGLAAGAAVIPAVNPMGFAFITLAQFFVPPLMGIVASLFSQGTVMAVYVPFVPFLIYAFTALGWFALVVESMVAAPLVALGMTHPEGHDLMGAGQQAIMLLLSVFLRPILIVIGLVSGMLLSRIGLQYVNNGFLTIMASKGEPYPIMTFIAYFYMYIGVIIAVVHTAFNMIHEVPSKVMRWIGLAGESAAGGSEAALSGAKGGAEKGAQATSKAMESSTDGASKAGKAGGKSAKALSEQKGEASATPDSGGGGGNDGGGGGAGVQGGGGGGGGAPPGGGS